MHPLLLEILPLIKEGFCCSQLLMHIFLQSTGNTSPTLVRSVHGLCFGMGGAEGPCGLLTGGACILGCVAGRGRAEESTHSALAPMVHSYEQWFTAHIARCTQACTDTKCYAILEGLSKEAGEVAPQKGEMPNPLLCGELLAACWEKLCLLMEEYEIEVDDSL